MFKLFINNVQIGNYRSIRDMFSSAIMSHGSFCGVKWNGNSCFITTY